MATTFKQEPSVLSITVIAANAWVPSASGWSNVADEQINYRLLPGATSEWFDLNHRICRIAYRTSVSL